METVYVSNPIEGLIFTYLVIGVLVTVFIAPGVVADPIRTDGMTITEFVLFIVFWPFTILGWLFSNPSIILKWW